MTRQAARHLRPTFQGEDTGASGGTPELLGSELFERGDALAELSAAFAEAASGRGRLLVVAGVAGSGKSALLAALRQRAALEGLRVLDARGGELERDFTFGTVRELFERAVEDAAPAERDRLLAGAAAPAAAVVTPGAIAHVESGFGALHAIYWLATNLSVATPLLIVVDDLHWVDPSSLRALSFLARRLADLPITLAVGLRPDEPGGLAELIDAVCDQPDALRTRLPPLGAGSVAAIVRRRIPGADDELCGSCYEASAGNPFFLRELLVSIGAGPSVDDVLRFSLPALGERVVRRIARIGPTAPLLAQAMAVLGDGARLVDAAAVAGLDEADAATAAARMVRVEILRGDDPIAFSHPLVRRSVYDVLTVTERDDAHAAAADVLSRGGAGPEVVASHFAKVRPSGSVAAVAALRDAAAAALGRGAPEAAVAVLRRALAEDAPDPGRAVLLAELGHVELMARDPVSAEHLSEALELADDPVLKARASLDLAEILGIIGHWGELLELSSRSIVELGDLDRDLTMDHEAYRACLMAYNGRYAGLYREDRERLLGLASGESWAAHALSATIASVDALTGNEIAGVLRLAERAVGDGRLLAERGAGGWASAQAIGPFALLDELDRAAEVNEAVAAQAQRDGSLIGALTSIGFRGWIAHRHGDLRETEAEMKTAVDLIVPNGLQMAMGSFFNFLWDAVGERPGIDEMLGMAETVELNESLAEAAVGAFFHEARGRLALARGDREEAVVHLRRAEPILRALAFGPVHSTWRSALALALAPTSRDEALALVAEERELAEATGLARPRALALRYAAMVEGGDDKVDKLRHSVELLEESPSRLEHARSLVALGSALRRGRQRIEARAPLSAAVELARECGANRTSAHAAEELLAAGARPRRQAQTGPDALTASEARVARLASSGRSNAEVAQELFVSLKTVETHLSHVYAKLGLSGRGVRERLAGELLQGRDA